MQEKDIVAKAYFENPERFADLMNAYVYAGEQILKAEDIKEIRSEEARIDNDEEDEVVAQRVTADVAGNVQCGMQVAVVLLENQSYVHYAMPVRVMNEESIRYHRQWREIADRHKHERGLRKAEYISGFTRKDRLIPTVTLVVYLGDEPWDGPVCLHDMLELEEYPKEIQKLIVDYPIHLLEARKYTNLEDFRTDIRYVFGFFQRENDKNALREYVAENREVFSELSQDAFNMISVMTHTKELRKVVQSGKKKGEKCDMCKAIREMLEDERIVGRQEGRQEGENRLTLLINRMSNAGEAQFLSRLGEDADFLQEMYVKYGV